jgi:hypothetical protein
MHFFGSKWAIAYTINCVCQSISIVLYNFGCMTLVLASEEKAVGRTKTTFSFILLSFPLTAKLCDTAPCHHHLQVTPRDRAVPHNHRRLTRVFAATVCSLRCRHTVIEKSKICFTPLLTRPQGCQGCQKIRTTKLKYILVSWSAKIQPNLRKI